jgi:hypothetical protein
LLSLIITKCWYEASLPLNSRVTLSLTLNFELN